MLWAAQAASSGTPQLGEHSRRQTLSIPDGAGPELSRLCDRSHRAARPRWRLRSGLSLSEKCPFYRCSWSLPLRWKWSCCSLATAPETLVGENGEARAVVEEAGGESPILGAKRKGRSEAQACTRASAEGWGDRLEAGAKRRAALTAPRAKPLSVLGGVAGSPR